MKFTLLYYHETEGKIKNKKNKKTLNVAFSVLFAQEKEKKKQGRKTV